MRPDRTMLVWLIGVLVVATLLGCGSKGPPMATVTGTVTMGGKPVDGTGVIIQSDAGGAPATANTDASGNFKVEALLGPSKVAISKTNTTGQMIGGGKNEDGSEVFGDTSGMKTEFITPVKYASAMTSGLTVDVQPGMAAVTFDLK